MKTGSVEKVRERLIKLENDPQFVAEGLKLAFADDLVRLLETRGLKQTELAEKLGTNRGYITRVLDTEYNLTIETMARIALALDARITVRMLPREESESSSCARVSLRAQRRERSDTFIAAGRPGRAGGGDFMASDKPVHKQRRR